MPGCGAMRAAAPHRATHRNPTALPTQPNTSRQISCSCWAGGAKRARKSALSVRPPGE
jgi:hypothetical protein